MVTEADWATLEASPGTYGESSRLIDPTSKHSMFLIVQQPGRRRLFALRVDDQVAEQTLTGRGRLPKTRGLELHFAISGQGKRELRIALAADELKEVFNTLVTDVADSLRVTKDGHSAALAVVERFDHWRQLLAAVADAGLSAEWRRGLVGELHILHKYVLPELSADDAVRAWVGPTGTSQDFHLAGGAIEVKTSSGKQPQTMVISNERELDPLGSKVLLLAHVSVDERRGGEGLSLNKIVDELRTLLPTSSAKASFDELLVRIGYLTHQRDLYEEPRYTLRQVRVWHVFGDFPRITEADLRPGVGDCRYRITTAGLEQYIATDDMIRQVVKGDQ